MADHSEKLPRKKVIGIECESLEEGTYGIARLVSRLLDALAERTELRQTHHFILYCNRGLPERFKGNPLFTVRPVGLPRWGLPSSFSIYYFLLLPLRLWLDQPDGMYWPNYMLPVLHPPRIPSAVLLTEDVLREARDSSLPLRYRLAYRIFAAWWAVRKATRIIAISHASRETLIRDAGITPERIAVNPLAVDTPRSASPELGAYFLWVGQAFPRRHLREALLAFERIGAERPDILFRIVGPDKYPTPTLQPLLQELNAKLGRTAVLWEKAVSDERLAALYAGATALIYVSDVEAFGLPPLEALSYGTPAIVLDAPVNREIYGSYAWFSSSTSERAIQDAMRRACSDVSHRQAIRENAHSIISRYTWHAHAQRFLDMMTTL